MGKEIGIILFYPNTMHWGGGWGFEGGDPKVIHGSFLDHFAHCTSNYMPMLLFGLVNLFCVPCLNFEPFSVYVFLLDHFVCL